MPALLDRSNKLVGLTIFLAQNHLVNYTSILANIKSGKLVHVLLIYLSEAVSHYTIVQYRPNKLTTLIITLTNTYNTIG
jgi:hypothetical protein